MQISNEHGGITSLTETTLTMVLGVVVPYFENEAFLREMMLSLRRQDSDAWRALVVDDSINGLSEESRVWITVDPRVSILRNSSHLGPAKSWNIGLAEISRSNSTLEAVAVVHADDRLHHNFVKVALSAHRDFPEAVAIHTGVATIDHEGNPTTYLRDVVKRLLRFRMVSANLISVGDEGLATIVRGNFVFCPSLSYKIAELTQPVFCEKLLQTMDLDLVARMLFTGRPIVGLKRRLYFYRRHKKSLTFRNESSGIRFTEEATTYAAIARVASDAGFTRSARVAAKMNIVVLHCLYLMLRTTATLRLSRLKSLKRELFEILAIRKQAIADLR